MDLRETNYHECDRMPSDVTIRDNIIIQGAKFWALVDDNENNMPFQIDYCAWCGKSLERIN